MLVMRAGYWTDARVTSLVPSLPFGLCALVIVGSLVLGGSTRSGFMSDAVLQFLSIPPLLVSLWQFLRVVPGERRANSSIKWGLVFCVALAGIPLIHLVPLPPTVWTALPNRQAVAEAFKLAGDDLPWMPISVSPEATWLSAVSLIPPVAVFLSTLLLGYAERRLMSLLVLSVGVISAFLGLVQVAQGPSSPLRFFAITNTTEGVGLLAYDVARYGQAPRGCGCVDLPGYLRVYPLPDHGEICHRPPGGQPDHVCAEYARRCVGVHAVRFRDGQLRSGIRNV